MSPAKKLSATNWTSQVPIHFLPSKIYHGQRTSQPTVRYFVDKFPMFLGSDASSSLRVTFTYLQGSRGKPHGICAPSRGLPAAVSAGSPSSDFLYLARVDSHFEKAKELSTLWVAIPLGSDASADLLRYFQIRKAWDPQPVHISDRGGLDFPQPSQESDSARGALRASLIADGKSDE